MEMIFGYLQQGFGAIVPFVVLLGLLIFVHELGHFSVAKWCGVRVEVFSLGFGRKIFSYKRGDTTYAISLIPLGGYVKMFGDEMGADISEEQKKHSFLHKSVWQRIAIVLAGPLMNFFFAILVFMLVAMIGEDVRSPVVGDVPANSTAFSQGLRSGDQVVSVDGQKTNTWDEFQHQLSQKVGKETELTVQRYGSNEPLKVQVSPKAKANPNVLSLDEYIGEVDGLSNQSAASILGVKPNTTAAKLGLQTGDRITKINGKEIQYFREVEPVLVALQGQTVQLDIERWESLDNKEPEILKVDLLLPSFSSLEGLGIEKSDLYLAKIVDKSPASRAGFESADRILAVGSVQPQTWEDVLTNVKTFKGEGELEFTVQRGSEQKKILVTPEITSQMNAQGGEDKRYTIGIVPWVAMGVPALTKVRITSPIAAVKRGAERTWDVTVMTVVSFVRLAQNKISPKSIGGVISIGQAASETFRLGIAQFLIMMGIISVNLFILNLLPIPVLDGGHLVFYSIEAIKGSPLSMRKMEVAQQVGLVLLMSLMVFALFNDFSRIFGFH